MCCNKTESKATGSVPKNSEFGDSSGNVFHGRGDQTLSCQFAKMPSQMLIRTLFLMLFALHKSAI